MSKQLLIAYQFAKNKLLWKEDWKWAHNQVLPVILSELLAGKTSATDASAVAIEIMAFEAVWG